MKIYVESVEIHGDANGSGIKMSIRGRDENLRDTVNISMPLSEEQMQFLWDNARTREMVNVEISFTKANS